MYSKIKYLRMQKLAGAPLAAGIIGNLIKDFSRPIMGAMGTSTKMKLQAARFQTMSSGYKQTFFQIVQMDPQLKDFGNKEALGEAYKVMIKVAPQLAREPLIARAFLRQFIMGDGVISEQSIKSLAETESKYTEN